MNRAHIQRLIKRLPVITAPDPESMAVKSACESSFYSFCKAAWPLIEGGRELMPTWHIQAICEHLEALYNLDISRLIINCPPRMGKSNVCSVLFPAWVWTKSPAQSFIYSSYAQSLSTRDSMKCRRLIQSPWYQKLWGDRVMLTGDMNSKMKFENVKSGFRMSSSVGGSNTGFGAHYEIEDDPNNVLDVSSDTIREKVNDWHDFVMSSRHAGVAAEFRRLVVQQRTHFKDVTGHILSKGDERWVHLRLPMEFEGNARSKTIPLPMSKGKVFEDPRQQDGELLWPEGMNRVQLDNFKKRDFKNDSYKIAGQLQQRPSPEGGGVLNTSWFKLWKEHLPEFEYVLQSWDTALTSSAESCYSACTTWGVFDRFGVKNIMLLSVFKEKVEYPELRKMATRLYNNYMDVIIDDPLGAGKKPNMILIEEKVSGYSLLADLMRANLPVMRFKPKGDKVGRCRLVSHIPENGLVWVTADAPGSDIPSDDAALFIESAELFPSSDVNDVIDSMSQAFLRLISAGWIMNKEDPPLIQNETEIWEKNRK